MKIAIVTDSHCGSGNDNKFLNDYFISFYEDQFFPFIEKNNIKTVIHLGDVFDRRKYVNFSTLSSWRNRVFSKLNSLCDRVDILIGNHDTYYKDTNRINSVVELLSIYNNFNFYETASEVFLDKLKVLYVPWICTENEEFSLSAIQNSNAQICMGHLEICGFEMYLGRISESGLTQTSFDKFYMTFSGHYHQKSSKNGIHYLGAPYPMTWGDYGCSRGFHVFDTDTLELTHIPNTKEMFYKVYYNDSTSNSRESILSQDYQYLADKFVKVIVDHKTDPYVFEKFLESIQMYNPADLSIIESFINTSSSSDDELDQTKDTLTILNECADLISSSNSDDLDAERLQKYRNDLKNKLKYAYTEALTQNEHIQSKS